VHHAIASWLPIAAAASVHEFAGTRKEKGS